MPCGKRNKEFVNSASSSSYDIQSTNSKDPTEQRTRRFTKHSSDYHVSREFPILIPSEYSNIAKGSFCNASPAKGSSLLMPGVFRYSGLTGNQSQETETDSSESETNNPYSCVKSKHCIDLAESSRPESLLPTATIVATLDEVSVTDRLYYSGKRPGALNLAQLIDVLPQHSEYKVSLRELVEQLPPYWREQPLYQKVTVNACNPAELACLGKIGQQLLLALPQCDFDLRHSLDKSQYIPPLEIGAGLRNLFTRDMNRARHRQLGFQDPDTPLPATVYEVNRFRAYAHQAIVRLLETRRRQLEASKEKDVGRDFKGEAEVKKRLREEQRLRREKLQELLTECRRRRLLRRFQEKLERIDERKLMKREQTKLAKKEKMVRFCEDYNWNRLKEKEKEKSVVNQLSDSKYLDSKKRREDTTQSYKEFREELCKAKADTMAALQTSLVNYQVDIILNSIKRNAEAAVDERACINIAEADAKRSAIIQNGFDATIYKILSTRFIDYLTLEVDRRISGEAKGQGDCPRRVSSRSHGGESFVKRRSKALEKLRRYRDQLCGYYEQLNRAPSEQGGPGGDDCLNNVESLSRALALWDEENREEGTDSEGEEESSRISPMKVAATTSRDAPQQIASLCNVPSLMKGDTLKSGEHPSALKNGEHTSAVKTGGGCCKGTKKESVEKAESKKSITYDFAKAQDLSTESEGGEESRNASTDKSNFSSAPRSRSLSSRLSAIFSRNGPKTSIGLDPTEKSPSNRASGRFSQLVARASNKVAGGMARARAKFPEKRRKSAVLTSQCDSLQQMLALENGTSECGGVSVNCEVYERCLQELMVHKYVSRRDPYCRMRNSPPVLQELAAAIADMEDAQQESDVPCGIAGSGTASSANSTSVPRSITQSASGSRNTSGNSSQAHSGSGSRALTAAIPETPPLKLIRKQKRPSSASVAALPSINSASILRSKIS